MNRFKDIEEELFQSKHCDKKVNDSTEFWDSIKNNRDLLEWAIRPTKDKFGKNDVVNGMTICENMLIDYDNVDSDLYQKLIDLIYSNKQIARIVLDGYSNGGYSYLLMSLWNPNLKLTDKQKAFAVDEAMNKIGTVRYKTVMDEFFKHLDEKEINDSQTMYTEFGGSINPVGAKTGNMYINDIFNSFSSAQAHGLGEFDIRYWILRNPNWSDSEKQKLIMDFWTSDTVYDETLEQWEWEIVNDSANYKGNAISLFDRNLLYDYSYDVLLKFYGNRDTTDRIWDEINFCRKMHKFRPQLWETSFVKSKDKKKVSSN